MFLRIKTFKKMHIIILRDSGDSGDEVQDNVSTTKHPVLCTSKVATKLYPGY